MGQALYRKHRPKALREVIGQEHITGTLATALKQGRISHAYLFTGPRGVGKTSIARILAHEINGLPYLDDSAHLDIIEIDAASNRRIDEIRELRDKVYVAPTSAKYKVYIIDEVHMLTKEAFNALLKTLEEPPAHVVFILATTDAHKLPETIISRTQRFSFRPVSQGSVVAHLQQIAASEGLKVSPEALELLAEHGEGSFRDSISLLDQAAAQGSQLEADTVRALLGMPSVTAVAAILQIVQSGGTSADMMTQLNDLYSGSYQAATIAKQISQLVRQELLTDESGFDSDQALDVLSKLLEVPTSGDPERYLEIVLLGALPKRLASVAVAEKPTPEVPKTEVKQEVVVDPEPVPEATPKAKAKLNATGLALNVESWPQVLQVLKQRHNTLYGVVRMAEPSFPAPGEVKLGFAFAFHEKRIREAANRRKLADIIEELTGQPVSVECEHDKDAKPPKTALADAIRGGETSVAVGLPASDMTSPPELAAISNIFGGAELLES